MNTVTSRDGTKIVYDKKGNGPALIFVTGAICHRRFGPVEKDVKILAEKFTVYTYDRRGRGDSGDTLPYQTDRELEDLEALIDAIGAPVFLYGHSSGAVIAFEASMKFPGKVKAAALYEAPYAPNGQEQQKSAALASTLRRLIEEKQYGPALKTFLSDIGMPKLFIFLLPLMPGWGRMKALAPTLLYDMALTSGRPPVDRAAKLPVPTLVLYGEKTAYDFKSVSEQLSAVLPEAELKCMKGQDHMVDTKQLLPLFENFFAGVKA